MFRGRCFTEKAGLISNVVSGGFVGDRVALWLPLDSNYPNMHFIHLTSPLFYTTRYQVSDPFDSAYVFNHRKNMYSMRSLKKVYKRNSSWRVPYSPSVRPYVSPPKLMDWFVWQLVLGCLVKYNFALYRSKTPSPYISLTSNRTPWTFFKHGIS